MKLPQFSPDIEWKAPALSSLPSWADAKRICIDIETKDPDLKAMGPGVRTNGHVIGVGFAIEDGPKAYLPMRHQGGGNLDEAQVWNYLRDNAKATKATIVHANGQYDHDYLQENGVDLYHCPWFDVQIADPCLYELHMRYNLDVIAERWGLPGKDEALLKRWASVYGINPKSDMWRLPAGAVGPYAEQDCLLPLQIARLQEKAIEEAGLERVFELESKLQPVLLKMRRRGVAVNLDRLSVVRTMAQGRERKILDEITRKTGVNLDASDINSSDSWAQVLKNVGIEVPRTKTGKPSVTKDILKAINHPVSDLITEAKKYNKLHGTFCNSAERFAVNGRIHCTFNQMIGEDDSGDDTDGAKYGRLSCKQPNLQQQPSPDKDPVIGKAIRDVFVPDPGDEWACFDYSQQEPRWTLHYAELVGAPMAKEAADMYRNNPRTDYHGMVAMMINPDWPSLDAKAKKAQRSSFKEISLGKAYGMGGAKMCSKLGYPTKIIVRYQNKWLQGGTPEADKAMKHGGFAVEVAGEEGSELIKKFDKGVPYLSSLELKAERNAIMNGYIRTVGGRHCHFPPLAKGKFVKRQDLTTYFDWVHKALNRLIQGSAGDQMKQAMIDLDAAGVPIQLQVHDEVDLSIQSRDQCKQIVEIMLAAIPCSVPHLVDVEVGPSWGRCEEIHI